MSSSVWTTSFFNFLTTFMSQQREIFIYCLNFEWWHQHCWVYIFCTMATLWASRSGRGVCCADIWSYCGFLMKGQHCEHPKDRSHCKWRTLSSSWDSMFVDSRREAFVTTNSILLQCQSHCTHRALQFKWWASFFSCSVSQHSCCCSAKTFYHK